MFGFKFFKKDKVEEVVVSKSDEEMGLAPQPIEINPPVNTQLLRAAARYQRLLNARVQGQKVHDDEIEKYRLLAQG